jgi:hypothetical protein
MQQNFVEFYEARPPGVVTFVGRQNVKRRLNEGESKYATTELKEKGPCQKMMKQLT